MIWILLPVLGILALFTTLVIGTSRRVNYDKFAAVLRISLSSAIVVLGCVLFWVVIFVPAQPGSSASGKIMIAGFAAAALGWAIPQLRRGITALRDLSPPIKS
jgi:hypothetical protein